MIRLSWRAYLLILKRHTTKMAGNTDAASRPFCIFSLDFVQIPTSDGPNVPPMSPARASIANMAVPPVGMRFDVMLMEPGHMSSEKKWGEIGYDRLSDKTKIAGNFSFVVVFCTFVHIV